PRARFFQRDTRRARRFRHQRPDGGAGASHGGIGLFVSAWRDGHLLAAPALHNGPSIAAGRGFGEGPRPHLPHPHPDTPPPPPTRLPFACFGKRQLDPTPTIV